MLMSAVKKRKKRNKKCAFRSRLLNTLRFLLFFNVLSLPLYFFSRLDFPLYGLQHSVASLTTFLLGVAGFDAHAQNNLISVHTPSGMFAGFIDRECTGAKMMLGFLALCFATQEATRKKLKSLLFLPLIYFANVLRVFSVFLLVCFFGAESFEFVHNVIFNTLAVLVIIAMWIGWMKFVK